MPDISLFTPLCEMLEISVNELVNGERIVEEQLAQKAEENIIGTLKTSSRIIKLQKKKTVSAVAVFVIIIVLLVITIDKALYSPCAFHEGDVTAWSESFPNHSAYALALNDDGKPVFKNPQKALRKAKQDCSDAIKVVRKEHHLLPLSKYNYRKYFIWSWQTAPDKELENNGIDTSEQGVDLTRFLDIYENSFK